MARTLALVALAALAAAAASAGSPDPAPAAALSPSALHADGPQSTPSGPHAGFVDLLNTTESPETFLLTAMVLSQMELSGPEAAHAALAILRGAERLELTAGLFDRDPNETPEPVQAMLVEFLTQLARKAGGRRMPAAPPAYAAPAGSFGPAVYPAVQSYAPPPPPPVYSPVAGVIPPAVYQPADPAGDAVRPIPHLPHP